MSTAVQQAPPSPSPRPARHRPARHRGDRVRSAIRGVGELFITLGLVMLLLVVYEVYWTNLVSAGKQQAAASTLDQEWAKGDNPLIASPNPAPAAPAAGAPAAQRSSSYAVAPGQGFAKLYIPTFGPDYQFTVLEGTDAQTLDAGPGHYTGTAFPGERGNFAVAGHRVGKGAPFNDLDLLRSCDAIITETADSWFVYRVLPMADEVPGWSGGKGASAATCSGNGGSAKVAPLGGAYTGVVGQEIVDPSQSQVIAPVPNASATPDPSQGAALLTLTTCHPRFSAQQRLIIHAVLVKTWAKNGSPQGQLPPEMSER